MGFQLRLCSVDQPKICVGNGPTDLAGLVALLASLEWLERRTHVGAAMYRTCCVKQIEVRDVIRGFIRWALA